MKKKSINEPNKRNWLNGKKGIHHHNWKDKSITIKSLHSWIKYNYIHSPYCEICLAANKKLDWSNKDHKYSRNRSDWWSLCRKCHTHYDFRFLNKKVYDHKVIKIKLVVENND